MSVMDYVYGQHISLKKKEKKKIKDVLTITFKWIWEVDVFACVFVLCGMQIVPQKKPFVDIILDATSNIV